MPPARAGQHQTTQRPSARNPLFQDEITDLWAGIVSGRPQLAMAAFFPMVAYEQVKAIPDPAADWRNRLVPEYREDIMAAHAWLRGAGREARLLRVVVPESEAGWIPPGVCDNATGYWHVAGARVVYRARGRTQSFGIAALIAWRGRWYVVHLGGELRTEPGGMVDEPADGPGVPGPPGGCCAGSAGGSRCLLTRTGAPAGARRRANPSQGRFTRERSPRQARWPVRRRSRHREATPPAPWRLEPESLT